MAEASSPAKPAPTFVGTFRGLWPYIYPLRYRLAFAILVAGGLTVIGMLPPLLMRPLVNDVAAQGKWDLLPLLIGGLFGVIVLRAIMAYFNARAIAFVGQRIVGKLRVRVFRHMLNLPLRFHDRMSTGGLMQRVMGDVGAVQNLVTGHVITLCVDSITAIFALSVMLQLSWELTLLSLALLPLFYFNYRFWTGRIQLNNVQMRSEMDHVSSMLQERLSSHDLIASYAQEGEQVIHFRDRARASRDTAIQGIVYNLGFNHVTQFVNASGNTLVFVAAVYFLIQGSMEYGDVVAYGAYSGQLLGPVVRFVQILQAVNQSTVNIGRVNDVLAEQVDCDTEPGQRMVRDISGQLEFKNYVYRDPVTDVTVLDGVDLSVPAGMNLTLVGPPGSGKSTLLAGVRRQIDPDSGQLLVDGTDVRQMMSLPYRRAVPVVRDSTGIFRGTIRSNLAYGHREASDEQIHEALRVVGLDSFVSQMSRGLDTPVGAGGVRLSSGQRQRLGIARALVGRPPMLILDEATAALDAAAAVELLQSVTAYLPDTTILSVARRLGVAGSMEIIAVLDGGKVVETGTHGELMAKSKSRYRQLFDLQYGPSPGNAPSETGSAADDTAKKRGESV